MPTHSTAKQLGNAQLDTQRDIPASLQFGDIYFSPDDGIGESRYHFIEGNDLPNRFAAHLNSAEKTPFVIAETGFGTGLNFLLTAELWHQHCQQQPTTAALTNLHYISVEKYPIQQQQLIDIYRTQQWQGFFAQHLLNQYPQDSRQGVHDIAFTIKNTSITLSLLLGDASEQLAQYPFSADAWFLDGFAPSKNPDMWSETLFSTMAKRSKSGTTFATFTAASAVRRGLTGAGFHVTKGKGFGRKRERLLGIFKP